VTDISVWLVGLLVILAGLVGYLLRAKKNLQKA